MSIDNDPLYRRREVLADACRVMAHQGLVENILGHISLRVGAKDALVRCRGPEERGLRFTTAADIRMVDLQSGEVTDDPTGLYKAPSELPIHSSVLLDRPEVHSVAHAHPPNVVTASLAGIELTPIFGAYDIPATRLAAGGIPVHPRSVLIAKQHLAEEMLASMGHAPALVLAGHGVVTTGQSGSAPAAGVAEAVLRALQVDTLARFHLATRSVGVTPATTPDSDLEELPDLGGSFNTETLWRHHLAELELCPCGRGEAVRLVRDTDL